MCEKIDQKTRRSVLKKWKISIRFYQVLYKTQFDKKYQKALFPDCKYWFLLLPQTCTCTRFGAIRQV